MSSTRLRSFGQLFEKGRVTCAGATLAQGTGLASFESVDTILYHPAKGDCANTCVPEGKRESGIAGVRGADQGMTS